MNSRFRPYRKLPHLSITNSVTRQGGSINIIQVTVYSFTVPALKLMKVKFCLFLATTAHCHDRAAIKIHITHFTRILMIRFRFRSIRSIFSDPVPVRFWPNTDRIDRIWLGTEKNVFFNLGVGFVIMLTSETRHRDR